jgi:hypothetical protein
MCKFRDLTANEIECRAQMVKDNGLALLLYKDARVDMNILDETVGPENWQREHYECKGNLFCRVGIYVPDEQPIDYNTTLTIGYNIAPCRKVSGWVWKADCGTESNTEAQKGEASDSFKRACVNWGIGRELYTSPFIWIDPKDCNIKEKKDRNGKAIYECRDKFIVRKIIIENKRITALAIWNVTKGCNAFIWQEQK